MQVRVGVAVLVPLDAGPGIIAVGRDLHRGPRAMLVEPAEAADELLLDPISPEGELIRFDGMDPELGLLAALDPLGPRITEQAVRQQSEMMGRPARCHLHPDTLGPVSGLLERDPIRPGRQFEVDRTGRPRAGLERPRFPFEFQEYVGQCDVTLIAHITDPHRGKIPRLEDILERLFIFKVMDLRGREKPVRLHRPGLD